MTLENFQPTFRNVLLIEVREEKTSGGIFIPSGASSAPDTKTYKVIKTGRLCEEVQPGDVVFLTSGIRPSEKTIDGITYPVVYEQQIDGYFRKTKPVRNDSIPNAPGGKSKTPRSSKSQARQV